MKKFLFLIIAIAVASNSFGRQAFYERTVHRTRWHNHPGVSYYGWVRKGDVDRWKREMDDLRKKEDERVQREKNERERNILNDKRAELKREFSFAESDFVSVKSIWENIKNDFRSCEFDSEGTNKIKQLVLQWTTLNRDFNSIKGAAYSDNSVIDVVSSETKQFRAKIKQFEKNLEIFVVWISDHIKTNEEENDESSVDKILKTKFDLNEQGIYQGKQYPSKFVYAALFVERFKTLLDDSELDDPSELKEVLKEQIAVLEVASKRFPTFKSTRDSGKQILEKL